MRSRWKTSLLFLALIAASSIALGDVIHLKDGRRVEGEILTRDEDEVTIQTASGRFRVFPMTEVEKIFDEGEEEPAAKPEKPPQAEGPKAKGKDVDWVDKATKRYERMLGRKLTVAVHRQVIARGDIERKELGQIAGIAQKTLDHFLKTYGCKLADVVPRRVGRDYSWRLEVFQFRLEKGYLNFVDRVLARIRDETVDDRRLALLRRQKGFWILTPHTLMAQYQGAGHIATSISNVAHKTSHVLLLQYKQAGAWRPWWFLEGFAVWQEIETAGEVRTYCLEVSRPGEYAVPGTPDADEAAKSKTAELWRSKVKAWVKARDERDLAVLARRSLNELVFEDVVQSWSLVDWMQREGVLRPFTLAYKRHRKLDKALEEVLETSVPGAHAQWRKWVLKTY